jgi:hypothetical protein
MIRNVIDNRKMKYRWKAVDVVIEPTWHDNTCALADKSEKYENLEGIGYDELLSVPIYEAFCKADEIKYPVTLYLYDDGQIAKAYNLPNHCRKRHSPTKQRETV